jgi:hypothetical protein
MPDMMAFNLAGMFGMSPTMYLQEKDNMAKLLESQKYYTDLLDKAGLTTKQANDNWVEMSRVLDRTTGTFSVLEDLVIKDLVDSGAISKFASAMQTSAKKLIEWDTEFGGKIGLVAAALGVLAGELTLEAILGKLLGTPKLLTRGIGLLARGGAAVAGTVASATGLVAGAMLLGTTVGTGLEGETSLTRATAGGGGKGLNGTRANRNNNPGNIEWGPFARAHGATGTDGRFAIFPSMDIGLSAMTALLQSKAYSGLNLAQIQRKWVGNDDANYLGGMESATGLGPGGIPNLGDAALTKRLALSMAKAEGATLGTGAVAGGDTSVTVNQKTDIHVAAGPTAAATAQAVAGAQDRVNQNTTRALVGAIR